jgi:hypothetical protein
MAAIEKICEYSGDYPGGTMFSIKRDHIQIMSEYRKAFRGKEATLYIQTKESIFGRFLVIRRHGFSYHINEDQYDDRIVKINGKYYDTGDCYFDAWHPVKIYQESWFTLVVPDMPGKVNGFYTNYSHNLSAVKRKLKRMLRCRKLKVCYIDDLANIKQGLK